jgi:hypothetical protein
MTLDCVTVASHNRPVRGDADAIAATIVGDGGACGARWIERSEGTVGGAQKGVKQERSV